MYFEELNFDEMETVNGGGVKQAAQVGAGIILVSVTPAVGVGAAIVGTPLGGMCAAGTTLGAGLQLIGAGCHK